MLRLREAVRMGFTRIVLPEAAVGGIHPPDLGGDCELLGVRDAEQALELLVT
jgi:hypothetical protein